jgi:hypothetical protein
MATGKMTKGSVKYDGSFLTDKMVVHIVRMQFPLVLQVAVTHIFLVLAWKTLFEFACEHKSKATHASKSLLSVKHQGTDQKSRLREGRHQSKARRV